MIKEELLKLLKEDPEFRRQMAELLGLAMFDEIRTAVRNLTETVNKLNDEVKELIEVQKRNEERFNKLNEIREKNEERFAQLSESQRVTDEKMREVLEAQKKNEERFAQLSESQRVTDEKMREVLEAQKKNEERFAQLSESQRVTDEKMREVLEAQKKNEERFAQLSESQRVTDEKMREVLEAQKKNEERFAQLSESQKRTEESIKQLYQALFQIDVRLNQLIDAHKETENTVKLLTLKIDALVQEQSKMKSDIERINRTISSIGQRWGVDYETLIKNFFDDFIKGEGLNFEQANKFTYKDDNGVFGRKGLKYEIDILAKNNKVYLIEVKSFCDIDDVEWFDYKSDVIAKVLGIKDGIKMILAVNTTDEAKEMAEKLGMKLIYGDIIKIEKQDKG
ncbi:DUF3782 domain-containing protein [Metallosphaera hakonensis]|nr:DUF3782 domain-containing protein [Metallosphaera hakonensis]